MALQVTKIEEVNKKVFIDNNFFSIYRSVLTLPIFNLKNKEIKQEIKLPSFSYYKNVKIITDNLNVSSDFAAYCFITLKSNQIKDDCFEFNMKEFYDFVDPDHKQINNRKHIKEEFAKSLIKFRRLTVVFDIDETTYFCGLLDYGLINDNICKIKMSSSNKMFWKADSNNIYNIEYKKIYSKLKLDYSKIMYTLIVSNNIREYNTFSIEKLKERFLSQNMEEKKFVYNIRQAINELKKIGFIIDSIEDKELKKTIAFKIKTKEINIRKIAEEAEKNKQVSNKKHLPEVKKEEENKEDYDEDFSHEIEKEKEEFYIKEEEQDDDLDDVFTNKF